MPPPTPCASSTPPERGWPVCGFFFSSSWLWLVLKLLLKRGCVVVLIGAGQGRHAELGAYVSFTGAFAFGVCVVGCYRWRT